MTPRRILGKVTRFFSPEALVSDPFAAIRPFNDDEVRPTIERLLASPDFIAALLRLRLGKGARYFAWLLRPLLSWLLRHQLRDIRSVHDLQMRIKGYVEHMIEDTTAGFTVSGLQHLDPGQAHLFISNHRDIAMDPAFTNYALHRAGHRTLRIAIGDNLLTEQWVADLMRLNKAFIVQRSARAPRELLAASRLLSEYIRHSIQVDNESVWIAQREGRAKNGVDRTEPAVIKMLSLCRDKQKETFGDLVASLHIVPVAISYELDPCDGLKAHELSCRASTGSYAKADREDVASIGRGIAGSKGLVHVAFGTPLGNDLASPEEVARAIDRQIVSGYRLRPPSLWAYERLHGPVPADVDVGEGSSSRAAFQARIDALPEADRPYALASYANALRSVLELQRAP